MENKKSSGAMSFVIFILIVLFLISITSGGKNSSNSNKPSSSMKSTYETTLQKAKDGVPLTKTEKSFLESYVKAGY